MPSIGTAVLKEPQGTCGNRRHTGGQEGGGGDPGRPTGAVGGGGVLSSGEPVIRRCTGPRLHRCWAGAEGLGMGLGGFTRKLGSFLRGAQGTVLVGDQEPEKAVLTSWSGPLPRANGKKKQHGQHPRACPEALPCCLFCPQPGVP